jgi:hypothetical protein
MDRDRLAEINPEMLLADGLEDALIGVTSNHHHSQVAVYSHEKCIKILMDRDGMSEEEAEEFFQFNTLGAYVGQHGPLFVAEVGNA